MINHRPFFWSPFSPYSRSYPRNPYYTQNSMLDDKQNDTPSPPTEIRDVGDKNRQDKKNMDEKKSSKYYNIGPIFINTNGFGQKLYLDDLIILALLFFLYKEDVKDDMLFILLILLLVS